jgi:hypothetical protein
MTRPYSSRLSEPLPAVTWGGPSTQAKPNGVPP